MKKPLYIHQISLFIHLTIYSAKSILCLSFSVCWSHDLAQCVLCLNFRFCFIKNKKMLNKTEYKNLVLLCIRLRWRVYNKYYYMPCRNVQPKMCYSWKIYSSEFYIANELCSVVGWMSLRLDIRCIFPAHGVRKIPVLSAHVFLSKRIFWKLLCGCDFFSFFWSKKKNFFGKKKK